MGRMAAFVQKKCSFEIQVHDCVPIGFSHAHDERVSRGARIVHQDVEPSKRIYGRLDQAIGICLHADIGSHNQRLAPGGAYLAGDLFGCRGAVRRVDDDLRSLFCQEDSDSTPDAARAACDDGNLACQVKHCFLRW
jgi:hypothetical protein